MIKEYSPSPARNIWGYLVGLFKAEPPKRSGWDADCLRWHDRVLTGQYRHYCPDWDYLPIDDSTGEFSCCTCVKIGLWLPGSVWLHVKSGGRYVLVDRCMIEADCSEAVLYRREDGTGPLWCRPMSEFTDGRFRPVSPPA